MFANTLKSLSQQADKLTKEAGVMATKYGKEAQKHVKAAMGKEQILFIGRTDSCACWTCIAEGGFAFVYKAQRRSRQAQIFALKRMLIQDEENLGLAETEIDIMKKLAGKPLRHPAAGRDQAQDRPAPRHRVLSADGALHGAAL